MKFRRREPKKIGIDITPLIDVVFLLLIFFMVSTTFVETPGIEVNLPKAQSVAVAQKPDSLEITLDAQHRIFLRGQQISPAQLWSKLEQHKAEEGPLPIIIRADAQARHEKVVFIMDQARKAGLLQLSIATLDEE